MKGSALLLSSERLHVTAVCEAVSLERWHNTFHCVSGGGALSLVLKEKIIEQSWS